MRCSLVILLVLHHLRVVLVKNYVHVFEFIKVIFKILPVPFLPEHGV